MILYVEKSFFDIYIFIFFFSALSVVAKNSSVVAQKHTPIAGLRMFVAFLVFAKSCLQVNGGACPILRYM